MIVRELTSMPLRHGVSGSLLKPQAGVSLAQLPRASLWQRPVSHVLLLRARERPQASKPKINERKKKGNSLDQGKKATFQNTVIRPFSHR